MTRLEELIISLTTVIVCYHDTQITNPKKKLVSEIDPTAKKLRDYAIKLINEPKYNDRLQDLIEICTKGYPDRKHFLCFLLHEVVFLKIHHARKEPYTPNELDDLQKQIIQLITDFKGLLLTQKFKNYKVTYSALGTESQKLIDLAGLINDAMYGNHFCNSGLLVVNEILGRFHMTENTSDDDLRQFAKSLCTELQNTLLVPALQSKLNDTEHVVAQNKSKIDELTLSLEESQTKLKKAELQIEELNKIQISDQTSKSARSETDELRKLLEETQLKLAKTESQIDELKKQKAQPPRNNYSTNFYRLPGVGINIPRRNGFFYNQYPTTQGSTEQLNDSSDNDCNLD